MTPRKKPLIYGPDGKPLVRVNDRLAPKPRANAGLEGWVEWGLIDRKGNKVQGGEQHNLILDGFLDLVVTSTALGGILSGNQPLFAGLSHFAVGTGSTPPDVTDTGLDNEIGRTAADITGPGTPVRVSAGVYELNAAKEFDFAIGNGNLTEFGFSYGASSPIVVRELFRDSGGNPITVTKTSDYKLRIRYILTVTLTPVVATMWSFNITGIGLVSGQHMFIGSTGYKDLIAFNRLAANRLTTVAGITNWLASPGVTASAVQGYTSNIAAGAGSNVANQYDISAYVPGVHERTLDVTFGTNNGNIAIRQFGMFDRGGSMSSATAGWTMLLDIGDVINKDNLHTLSVDEFMTVTWGRA